MFLNIISLLKFLIYNISKLSLINLDELLVKNEFGIIIVKTPLVDNNYKHFKIKA